MVSCCALSTGRGLLPWKPGVTTAVDRATSCSVACPVSCLVRVSALMMLQSRVVRAHWLHRAKPVQCLAVSSC
jgi:hypothetical protein